MADTHTHSITDTPEEESPETSGRYQVIIDGEHKPQQTSERKLVNALSAKKKKEIERQCNVTLTIDDTAGQIVITAGRNKGGTFYPHIAFDVMVNFLSLKSSHETKLSNLKDYIASQKRIREDKGRKPEIRRQQRQFSKTRTPSISPAKIRHHIEIRNVTDIGDQNDYRFLKLLASHNRIRALDVFEQDPRIGIKVELLRQNNTSRGKPVGYKIHMPVYQDGSTREDKWDIARAVLKTLANKASQSITAAMVTAELDAELERREKKAQVTESLIEKGRRANKHDAVPAAETHKQAYRISLPIKDLNGRPVTDFAEYLASNNRRTAMVAFRENNRISFDVKIVGDKGKEHYFEVIFNSASRQLDMTDVLIAQLLLAKLRSAHEDGHKINKEFVKDFLENALFEIEARYTEERFGDKITSIFASMATREKVTFNHAASNNPEKPSKNVGVGEPGTADPDKTAKKEAPVLELANANVAPERNFKPKVRFDLAPWHEDDKGLYIEHKNALGETEKLYPTSNQLKYIEALRSGDIRSILLHGETGTGKTFWAVRIALEMLQQGVYKNFFYERATVVVGTRQYSPYRKGGDTTIFSAVLEDEIAKHLGQGDIEKGYDIFNTLTRVGMIRRYDQMYRRGDNLDGTFLLADEVQDKDPEEVFHLTTRPKDTAKVVMVGDYKRQNDLGQLSGFARAFKMFSDPEITRAAMKRLKDLNIHIDPAVVTALKFGIEDIRRSPYTAYVVAVHEIFDEIHGEPESSSRPQGRKPVPGDRYRDGGPRRAPS